MTTTGATNYYYAKQPHQKRYSVDRLRLLYKRLLTSIDINVNDLCPRGMVIGIQEDMDDTTTQYSNYRNSSRTLLSTLLSNSISFLHPSKRQITLSANDRKKKYELDIAFRFMAASQQQLQEQQQQHYTQSIVSEKTTITTTASDGILLPVDTSVLRMAQKIENTVIQIIYDIGDVVINAECPSSTTTTDDDCSTIRSDDVFAYFCEKGILPMLVEIMIDQPYCTTTTSTTTTTGTTVANNNNNKNTTFNGVVWSPKVKAQIIQTITMLLLKIRDRTAIYYILSQNCTNHIILSVLPLKQWTNSAIQIMLYPYIDLLKVLSMHLSGSPDLFPLFTIVVDQSNNHKTHQGVNPIQQSQLLLLLFPLFTTVVQITCTSLHIQSNSYTYATCLNIIVGLLRIPDSTIRQHISSNTIACEQLCIHLSKQLYERYQRMINIITGPIVDVERSNVMTLQLNTFNDQLDVLNDIFHCNVHGWNVRLCELLVQEFIVHLVRGLLPGHNQQYFHVGITDRDVIPPREGRVQVCIMLLSRIFTNVHYIPFIRILATILFHPKSTPLWNDKVVEGSALIQALNNIAQGTYIDFIPNVFYEYILRLLSGEYGEWFVVTATSLFENALHVTDTNTLSKLHFIPDTIVDGDNNNNNNDDDCSNSHITATENTLTSFFNHRHEYESIVSTMALDSISVLAIKYVIQVLTVLYMSEKPLQHIDMYYHTSPLLKAFNDIMMLFYERTLQSLKASQSNDITLSLIESIIQSRYRRSVKSKFVYSLYPYGSNTYCSGSDALIRKLYGTKWNDTEALRFNISMSFHFRAINRIIHRLYVDVSSQLKSDISNDDVHTVLDNFDLVDEADEDLTSIFNCLQDNPSVGSDYDLYGRTKFNFVVHGMKDATSLIDNRSVEFSKQRIRTLSEDMMFQETSNLVLVLDKSNMIVVRPIIVYNDRTQQQRGVIICIIPILHIIAAACDDIRLHIAVQHENVGCLIKNGNMLITLDSPGTCHIVHQYVERHRKHVRDEMYHRILKLFSKSKNKSPGTISTTEPQQDGNCTLSSKKKDDVNVDDMIVPTAKTL